MSVIGKNEIMRRLSLDIECPECLVVTPLLEPERLIGLDAIDVRLGTQFIVPSSTPPVVNIPGQVGSQEFSQRIHIPLGSYIVVPAHTTVLGMTLEFIKLPNDLCGMILTKSSIARNFLVIETAPWIHPEYRGCLTLEIANVSNTTVVLYPGRPIGQLVLLGLDQPAEVVDLRGSYVGPVFPELPKLGHPRSDLERIGIGDNRFDPVDRLSGLPR